MENLGLNAAFWREQRVLLTGHTGFKGAWLSLWLQHWQAKVHGYALAADTPYSLYALADTRHGMSETIADINDATMLRICFEQFRPTVVFHLAAQAIVANGYADPVNTWTTNVIGTQRLLECVRHSDSVNAVVVVTTDKVYQNNESGKPFVETDPLGGHDPYSASKAACELLCESYYTSFLHPLPFACARAGNVIGGGDFAPHRLIPDVVRAWSQQLPLSLRQPNAVRPWQHVLESLQGYLRLAQALVEGHVVDRAWNFGPPSEQCCRVEQMLQKIAPLWPDNAGVNVARQSATEVFSEAGLLRLNSDKARHALRWKNVWDVDVCLQKTVQWYRAWQDGHAMREFSQMQLLHYLTALQT